VPIGPQLNKLPTEQRSRNQTPARADWPSVGMIADAARMSAYATSESAQLAKT